MRLLALGLLLSKPAIAFPPQDWELNSEVDDPELGLLQPLPHQTSNFTLGEGETSHVELHLQARFEATAAGQESKQGQAIASLTGEGGTVFSLRWSQEDQSMLEQLGLAKLLTLGKASLPASDFRLVLAVGRQVGVFINEIEVTSLQLDVPVGSLRLHVGKAMGPDEVDFDGRIFQVKLWRGPLVADAAPAIHLLRRNSCPALRSPMWSQLRGKTLQVLQCAFSSTCRLPSAPLRFLLPFSDEVLDRETTHYQEVCAQCPLGFALAYAVIFFTSYVEQDPDPVLTYGNLKFASRLLELPSADAAARRGASDGTDGSDGEASFGGARPLRWLSLFGSIARKRLRDIINLPAEGAPPGGPKRLWLRRRNHSHVLEESWDSQLASRLSVEILHDSELPLLRNSLESMATAGLLKGVFLVIRLTAGCEGPWSDPGSPEGWYLSWLQQRFQSTVVCGPSEVPRLPSGCGFVLRMSSLWHLLPFPLRTVWKILGEAMKLLGAEPGVVAVSMMEKLKQGLGALASTRSPLHRQGTQPDESDLKNFLRVAPALSPNWNLTEAARLLSDMYNLFAETTTTRWSLKEFLQEVNPCGELLCAPFAWWREELAVFGSGSSRSTHADVWLSRTGGSMEGKVVALSSGLFQRTRGSSYDYLPSAKTALGIPPCAACHLQDAPAPPAPAPAPPFTLYFTVLDVTGVCRECFGNLIYDALEALQLASFQGPEVVLVEPLISNAARRILTEEEADAFQKARKTPSVYAYFTKEAMCTSKFLGTTPFGDLFDWPALVDWLVQVRGIRGQISWNDFLEKTGSTIDMLTMQADHYDDNNWLSCGDSQEESTLRFYQTPLRVRQRVCVRSTKHEGGFELRFLDGPRFEKAILDTVSRAKAEGKSFATVGLFLYWSEGAERARLHPGRYGLLPSHIFYTSIWRGLRFSPKILQRAARVARALGLLESAAPRHLEGAQWRPFMAVHWRKGDLHLGPAPWRLVQAKLGEPENFGPVLHKVLREKNLKRLFLMTNARKEVVQKLREELNGTAELFQAPVLLGGPANNQRQLAVEMAIATAAEFFVLFGDGLITGHVSKPSLLTLQMRLHHEALPLERNSFAFAEEEFWAKDALGL